MSERETLFARAEELMLKLPGNIATKNLKAAIKKAEERAAANGAPPPDPDEMVSAIVLDALMHNGEHLGPDDPVELTRKQFDRLETLKVVRAV